jgi:uncharacterized protein YdbL (DUF1318 family)
MHSSTRTKAITLGIGILLGVVGMGVYGYTVLAHFDAQTQAAQADIESSFTLLAEQADRIEQTEESAQEVAECKKRARFEELLSTPSLQTPRTEHELEVLFAECADYAARLKEFYARNLTNLAREYEHYTLARSFIYAQDTHAQEILPTFEEIAALETVRSQLLRQQVALQYELILARKNQQGARTIIDVTTESAALATRLGEVNARIDELRTRATQPE